eukprot:SM000116S24261  [mRNA]  locus=s116:411715:415178:- [translate_table: standard]
MPVPRAPTGPPASRVVAHLDLDCFYVQVEQRRQPALRGRPTAVVQYNPWKGGALIAVGYEARAAGVKRQMRGDEARQLCPDLQLVQVPVAFGKADLSRYRDAGSEVVAVLQQGGPCERASIDEVFVDLTEAAAARLQQSPPAKPHLLPTYAARSHQPVDDGEAGVHEVRRRMEAWLCNEAAEPGDRLLASGAVLVAELRATVLAKTQFTCSAGIAHNKMLAKLASGMHKPAEQTVVPASAVQDLLHKLPIRKMKQLGGKLGLKLQQELGIQTVGDLLHFSLQHLQDRFGTNTGSALVPSLLSCCVYLRSSCRLWLRMVAEGQDGTEVKDRVLPKQHSSGKTFVGPTALVDVSTVGHWLHELAGELQTRLELDLATSRRTSRLLTVQVTFQLIRGGEKKTMSRCVALRGGRVAMAEDALSIVKRLLLEMAMPGTKWMIVYLGLSASQIAATPQGVAPITNYLGPSDPLTREPALPESCEPAERIPISLHPSQDQGVPGSAKLAPDSLGPFGQKTAAIGEGGHASHLKRGLSCTVTKERQANRSRSQSPKVEDLGPPNVPISMSDEQECLPVDLDTMSVERASGEHSRDCKVEAMEAPAQMLQEVLEASGDGNGLSMTAEGRPSTSRDTTHSAGSSTQTQVYKLEDVDIGVLRELPLEIQLELRVALSRKKPRTIPSCSISSYFNH